MPEFRDDSVGTAIYLQSFAPLRQSVLPHSRDKLVKEGILTMAFTKDRNAVLLIAYVLVLFVFWAQPKVLDVDVLHVGHVVWFVQVFIALNTLESKNELVL